MLGQVRRRRLLIATAALLGAPLAAFAQQQGKVWRIGILHPGQLAPRRHLYDALVQRMRELGYVEGENIQYEFRGPNKEGDPFDALAAELVRLNVDVIVATTTGPIAAAKRATQRIPIVMCPSTDPVGLGFIVSLGRPGGNLTGIANIMEETTGKRLQLLREMVPRASRVAVIWNAPDNKPQLDAAEDAARQIGVRLQSLEAGTSDAISAAFDAAVKGRADALMVAAGSFTFGLRSQIAALALKHRLPAIYGLTSHVDAGGLMTYGPKESEYFRQAAVYVDKILKGANPADLPVEQPTKFELTINVKTAKAIGIQIPQSVLIRADRLIE